MKYFYDTEFLEGRQRRRFLGMNFGWTPPTIDLISIGIVAEDGREYYAISNEFNLWEAWNRYDNKAVAVNSNGTIYEKVYWIRENVLKPIFNELAGKHEEEELIKKEWPEPLYFSYENMKYLLAIYGKSKKTIKKEIEYFTSIRSNRFGELPVELWAYYGAYDHVVLMWLWGKMIDKPQHLPMVSWDLKIEVDSKALDFKRNFCKGDTFDSTSFEGGLRILKSHPDYPKQDPYKAHNALEDARWNKQLYDFLVSLPRNS